MTEVRESTPALLRRAARGLRRSPHYGDLLRGGLGRGLHVHLVDDLEQRADELENTLEKWGGIASMKVDSGLASDEFRLEYPAEFQPTPMEQHIEARSECDGTHEHLPTFIDAKRVCYWCRRAMPV